MKKLITMLLALTMVVTLAVSGAMPVFADEAAATSNITPGGIYATKVWDDEINFVAAHANYTGTPYTFDNTAKTITVSLDSTNMSSATANFNTDGTNAIDLSGIRWAKSGKLIVTYDAELISKTEGMRIYGGLVGKVESSEGVNKWPYGGTGASQQPILEATCFEADDEAGAISSGMNVYEFTENRLTIYPYIYNSETEEYELTANAPVIKDNCTFSENQYYIYKLVPYIQTRAVKGTAEVKYSNITITEVYEDALLQNVAGSYDPDEDLDISINLPADYASAKLTIGGVEFADMTADVYAAGAYKVAADLSRLTYCGNLPVELDIVKADGTEEKLASSISVIIGPEMTSYGVEDFDDETYLYGFTAVDNIGVTDIPAATGRTGKAYGVTMMNSGNNGQIKMVFPTALAEGTSVDINFDVYLGGSFSNIQVYHKDLNNSAAWSGLIGYGQPVGTHAAPNNALCGQWLNFKITVDSADNAMYVYRNGELLGSKSGLTMNGLKEVYLSPKTSNQTREDFMYVDNVEFVSYVKGNKPAVASVTTNHDNGTIALTFDSAVAYTEGAITLDGVASTVAYDEATFTATITPTGDMTSLNGTIVVAESVAGYAMSIPATLPVALPFISNMTLTVEDGVYTGSVDVYNDAEEDLGKIYVAIYNGNKLAKVVSEPVVTVNGAATFSAPLTPDEAGTYTVQMFFWDADLAPVTTAVTPR